jgi:hypothetical protein
VAPPRAGATSTGAALPFQESAHVRLDEPGDGVVATRDGFRRGWFSYPRRADPPVVRLARLTIGPLDRTGPLRQSISQLLHLTRDCQRD